MLISTGRLLTLESAMSMAGLQWATASRGTRVMVCACALRLVMTGTGSMWMMSRTQCLQHFLVASAPDGLPFYLDKDQRRPYTYSCGLNDFRSLLGRVSGCDPKDYGLHSLRVTGYNLAKQSVGEELTVAHGGWKSSAHSRYGRFEFMLGKVLAMPAAMVGAPPPEEQAPAPREIRRGAGGARRQSARGGSLDQWISYSDEEEEEVQVAP